MHEGWKETVGFLCRWCLLGLAGVTIALVAWTNLPAAATVALDTEAGLLLPDTIWEARPRMYLKGFVPAHLSQRVLKFLAGRAGGPPRRFHVYNERIYVRVGTLDQGTHPVVLKGFPYSLHAFDRRRATWTIVRPGTAVLLIDARMADAMLPARNASWQRLIAVGHPRGAVVLFHPGPAEAFAKILPKLRHFHPRVPILCDFKQVPPADDSYVLRQVSWTLGRTRPPHGSQGASPPGGWCPHAGITVVTSDAGLAHQAASQKFTTHLLAPAGAEIRPHAHLTRHASLRKLEIFLARSSDTTVGRDPDD